MNDHIKSEILAFLAGELPESRNRQIESHAASCEKCRNALAKTRSKQARVKREALKKASPDPAPNLFLARQGKLTGVDKAPSRLLWWVGIGLVLAGIIYWAYQRKPALVAPILPSSAPPAAEPPAPAPAPAPVRPTPISPAKAPAAPKPPAPPKPPLVLHVFQDWKGPESGIQEGRLMVIRTGEDWQKLWADMQSKDPVPPVDFTDKIVLGVFGGQQPPATSIQFGKIEEDEDIIVAPYRFIVPAVQSSSGTAVAAPSAPSHPYLLAVVPRVDKKIRLMEKEMTP